MFLGTTASQCTHKSLLFSRFDIIFDNKPVVFEKDGSLFVTVSRLYYDWPDLVSAVSYKGAQMTFA